MNVQAEISYLESGGGRAYYYLRGTPEGEAPSNARGDRRTIEVEDARLRNPKPSLEKEGLELVAWSDVPTNERDAAAFQRDFYPRAEALVREHTGAGRVHAFDHNLRSSDKNMTQGTSLQPPVWLAHNDYSEASGPQRVRDLLPDEADELVTHRFA
ncbi:MAG: hypothetical protein NZ990_12155, partial [Myxococcota bacterium]|nr:hypothetical protein [Myxococcota bacterium]